MDDPSDFDAADLADAILGVEEPLPPPPPPTETRSSGLAIGPILIVALVAAIGLAIILAIGPQRDPEPPPCGGLYNNAVECCITGVCCVTDEYCEPPDCEPRDNRRGLFDAEEQFAPGGEPWCD